MAHTLTLLRTVDIRTKARTFTNLIYSMDMSKPIGEKAAHPLHDTVSRLLLNQITFKECMEDIDAFTFKLTTAHEAEMREMVERIRVGIASTPTISLDATNELLEICKDIQDEYLPQDPLPTSPETV